MKHSNVAIFIPHNGCPHQCSFCDQRSISGSGCQPSPSDVKAQIEVGLESLKDNAVSSEIAFFGGSFTAIDRGYMISLLEAAKPYIHLFRGIRISTRPDCIDEPVLTVLKEYGVSSIEIGAQSMDDGVLLFNERGHTSDDVRKACRLISDFGFELGVQMMTGLYKSSPELDKYTAKSLIELSPSTVRIYPTVVMKNTRLYDLYETGDYRPSDLEQAVSLSCELMEMFEQSGVRVIRVGLHYTDSLLKNMAAGPYHPAFRELCESKIILKKLFTMLRDKEKGSYTAAVAPSSVSKLIGNKRKNITKLSEAGFDIKVEQDPKLLKYEIELR